MRTRRLRKVAQESWDGFEDENDRGLQKGIQNERTQQNPEASSGCITPLRQLTLNTPSTVNRVFKAPDYLSFIIEQKDIFTYDCHKTTF